MCPGVPYRLCYSNKCWIGMLAESEGDICGYLLVTQYISVFCSQEGSVLGLFFFC